MGLVIEWSSWPLPNPSSSPLLFLMPSFSCWVQSWKGSEDAIECLVEWCMLRPPGRVWWSSGCPSGGQVVTWPRGRVVSSSGLDYGYSTTVSSGWKNGSNVTRPGGRVCEKNGLNVTWPGSRVCGFLFRLLFPNLLTNNSKSPKTTLKCNMLTKLS